MKKILKTVKKWILKLISFLFHLFFQPLSKKNIKKQEEQTFLTKKEDTAKLPPTENSTNPDTSQNLFKEHLEMQKKDRITKKQIEEELYKALEEIFHIKRFDFSDVQKEKLKIYSEKMIKKIEEEKINHKEELQKSLKEKIENDIRKKGKDLNKILDIEPVTHSEIPPEISIEQGSIVKTDKTPIRETETINFDSFIIEKNKEISKPILLQEKIAVDDYLFQKKDHKINPPIETPIINLSSEENWNQVRNDSENNDITEIVEKNAEEALIPTPKPQNEEMNTNSKENKTILKTSEETKKEITDEKKINPSIIEINFNELENQNNTIIDFAKNEYEKEELIDKEYEKIERLIDDKILELESLLHHPLTEEQKMKVTKELKKLKIIKEQVASHKEKDLEELRISLEESFLASEVKLVTEKMQEILANEELEIKTKLLKKYNAKTEAEIEKIKKIIIREQFQKILYKLEFPLILSFPFIKNKYFRRFINSFFIFRSFHFLKRMFFDFPSIEEPIDLSAIKKGSDALSETIIITEKNIYAFTELKMSAFERYPELLKDEEFLNTIYQIEKKLTQNYENLMKQEKVVNKYFHKSKIITRKRKLY